MHIHTLKAIDTNRLIYTFPVYYGWVILAVGAIGCIMTSPGQTYSIAVFIDSFITDLEASRSLVSTLYTVGTLAASFALPFVGRLLDRRGSRFMIVTVSLFLGLACIYMGFIRNAVMLFLGFFALRMLGQGSLSLVSNNVINQWWVRRRGMAMGIAGMTAGVVGFGGFPILINWLIPIYGWRMAFMLLGLGVLVIMLPLGSIFIRNRPEDFGLYPDGANSAFSENSTTGKDLIEEHWTLSEALRTPSFWIAGAGLASGSMLSTGLIFHLFSIFKDSGLSATVAASVFLPMAAATGIMHLGGGVLADRVPIRVILTISLLLQALTLIMAPFLHSVELALGFGLILGIRTGLGMVVSNVIWAKFYGRLHLGSITGVTTTIMVASSALGPMPFGVARDLMGSYTVVLIAFAGLPLILAIAAFLHCKPPTRQ